MPGSYGERYVQAISEHLDKYGNIKGKHGLVIGSQTPWLEGILLAKGAAKVFQEHVFSIGQPRPLFLFIIGLFKQTLQFLQQINVKNCPTCIWRGDLNLRPLKHESSPITTKRGTRPNKNMFNHLKNCQS